MTLARALELCVEAGRVNHSWCIGVDHSYGGLGGGMDGGDG